jgi:hypothetical protein
METDIGRWTVAFMPLDFALFSLATDDGGWIIGFGPFRLGHNWRARPMEPRR